MVFNATENSAVQYLKQNGFVVLSRNRRIGGVEIDIIGLRKKNHEKTYYLIEVKKTIEEYYRMGYPALSFSQIQRYMKAIENMNIQCGKFLDIRFALMVFNEKNHLVEFVDNMPFLNQAS